MSGLFGDCPAWLNEEAWAAYCAWRDGMPKHKRWGGYARRLVLKELAKLKDAGQDPTACLEQSLLNSWLGVYAVKKPAQFSELPANDSRPVVDAAAQTAQYLAARETSPEEIKAAAARARERLAGLKRRTA